VREFDRPVFFDALQLDRFPGRRDPAVVSRVAHDTAHLLVHSVRESADESLLRRLVHYTDEHGLDTLAELWSAAPEWTLPGILWRVYQLRAMIMARPVEVGSLYELGRGADSTVDEVVAGVAEPIGPEEVRRTSEEILRGVFAGDFGIALDRAGSFCHLVGRGCARRAEALTVFDARNAARFDDRAHRLAAFSEAFSRGAVLWREDALD
jgi:hypothetical protein